MIFAQSLRKVDETNPQEAIKKMANHIRYLQEQLEYTLLNLDNRNISEISVEKLGSCITIVGAKGESFSVGKTANGFEFSLKGEKGNTVMYLDSSGELNIKKRADLTIDGGEW